MDAFMDAYFAIDVDHSGTITTDELRDYMKKNDMDELFINVHLLTLVPAIIHVEYPQRRSNKAESAVAKGHVKAEVVDRVYPYTHESQETDENIVHTAKPLDIDYKVLAADLPENLQSEFVAICKQGQDEFGDDDSVGCCRELVKWIKLQLDKTYGRLWHCTIVRGRYSSYYSYQKGHSFVFKMDKRIFIIFKTPTL